MNEETTTAMTAETSNPTNTNGTATENTQDMHNTQTESPKESTYSKKDYDDMAIRQYNAGITKIMKEAGFEPTAENDFKKAIKEFKDWQNSQKTEAQLQKEALETALKEAANSKSELEELRQIETIRRANVTEDFIDVVQIKAAKIAKEKNISFDDALKDFLTENLEKYAKQDTRSVVVDTGTKEKDDLKTYTLEEIKNMSPDTINKNWAKVQETLKKGKS